MINVVSMSNRVVARARGHAGCTGHWLYRVQCTRPWSAYVYVCGVLCAEGVEYSKQHELRGPGPNIYVCVKYRCLACPCSRFMKLVCLLLSLNDENVMEVQEGGAPGACVIVVAKEWTATAYRKQQHCGG